MVDQEISFINSTSQEIKNEALKSIKEGMKNKQQSTVATALQVFFNFNILPAMVSNVVTHCLNSVQTTISNVLNSKQQLKDKTQFLVQLKSMLFDLETLYLQVHHLDMVIKKKRDTLSQVEFSTVLKETGDDGFLEEFWRSLIKLFDGTLKTSTKNNQSLKDIIVSEYPQVKNMIKEFANSLSSNLSFLSMSDVSNPLQ